MTTPARLLQAAILANPACAEWITLDQPKWLTPPVFGPDPENPGHEVLITPGVPNPDHVPAAVARQRDAQIARLMTQSGFGAASRQVPCHEFKKFLLVAKRWRGIKEAAADAHHPAADEALAAVELADDARMTADMRDPKAAPMLNKLVETGLLSAADRQALEAMCLQPANVTPEQVSLALRGPWGDEQ